MTELLILTLFPTLIVAAAIGDVLSLRIPNWLNGVTAGAVLPMAVLAGMPLEVLQWHLLAGAAMLTVGFGLFAANLLGGGDAKLIAAAGLWIGWNGLIGFVLVTALAGGVLALIVTAWQFARVDEADRNTALKRVLGMQLKLPYGIAIAVGAVWSYPETWWIERVI